VAAAAETTARPEKQPRRRRRRILLVSALVVLVLLVVAFIVAERLARDYASGYVRDRVVAALGLPGGSGVNVDLGGGSFLLQVATGSINEVTISAPSVDIGDVSGAAVVTATGVPLDVHKPVKGLTVTFGMNQVELTALSNTALSNTARSAGLGAGTITGVTLEGSDILVATKIPVLSLTLAVPATVGLAPGASDGKLVFTPESVEIGGQRFTAAQLRTGIFSGVAAPLLAARSFCIADRLPKALVLRAARVQAKKLVITLDGDGAVLGGGALKQKGSCPAG
jgi:hypothetical protein